MKNKSLRFKLFTLSTFLLILTLTVGTIGYVIEGKIVKEYSYIVERNLPNIKSLGLMISRYRLARIHMTELLVDGTSKEFSKVSREGYLKAWDDFEVEHQKYLKIGFAPGEEVLFQEFKKRFEDMKKTMDSVLTIHDKGEASGTHDRAAMLVILSTEIDQKGSMVRDSGNALLQYHIERADFRTASAASLVTTSTLIILGTIIVGTLLGGIYAVIFSNGLVKTLTQISDSLNNAGIRVSAGSSQIASTAQELSQSNTEQSASLEETAASIEEMSSMIQKSTENAKKTYDFAKSTKDSAVNGKQVVTEMIGSIEEINLSNQNIMSAIEESNKRMEEIVSVIGEIGNKTKVINDIVFQTKLLSFNASVEAARAGEMGKGFAVVAEEVGNLAQMSGNAAKEISEMLTASMTKVGDIVNTTKTKVERLIDDGKRKVEAGTVVAKKCGDVLDTIVGDIEDVTKLASEISVASEEQSKGIQEISKATAMLGTVTQQNSLASEESANASEDLSRQAEELNNLVSSLVQTISGGNKTFVTQTSKPASSSSSVTSINSPMTSTTTSTKTSSDTSKNNVIKMKNVKKVFSAPDTKTTKPVVTESKAKSSQAPSADDDRFMDA